MFYNIIPRLSLSPLFMCSPILFFVLTCLVWMYVRYITSVIHAQNDSRNKRALSRSSALSMTELLGCWAKEEKNIFFRVSSRQTTDLSSSIIVYPAGFSISHLFPFGLGLFAFLSNCKNGVPIYHTVQRQNIDEIDHDGDGAADNHLELNITIIQECSITADADRLQDLRASRISNKKIK